MKPFMAMVCNLYIFIVCNAFSNVHLFGTMPRRTVIYFPLKYYNLKMLNATGVIGSTSESIETEPGIVHVVSCEEEITALLRKDYRICVVITDYNLFKRNILRRLAATQIVTAIMIVGEQFNVDDVSDDTKCENGDRFDDPYCEVNPWNPQGTGILFEEYNIPVIGLFNMTAQDFVIKGCWEKYNRKKTPFKCAASVSLFMKGTLRSRNCLRRTELHKSLLYKFTHFLLPENQFCYSLEGKIVSMSLSKQTVTAEWKNIVLAVRLDSRAIFSVGNLEAANSVVTPLVSAIAVMKTLQPYKAIISSRNISLFLVLLFGDSWNYLNTYHILKNGTISKYKSVPNLLLKDVSVWIELSQLSLNNKRKLYFHVKDKHDGDLSLILAQIQQTYPEVDPIKMSVNPIRWGRTFPQSSINILMRQEPKLQGILVSNSEQGQTDRFYHSLFDTTESIGYLEGKEAFVSDMTEVVSVLSSILISYMANTSTTLSADDNLIRNLLSCYLESADCEYFRQAVPPYYTDLLAECSMGTFVGDPESAFLDLTVKLISFMLGEIVREKQSYKSCAAHRTDFETYWVNGELMTGKCLLTWIRLQETPSVPQDQESGTTAGWGPGLWTVSTLARRPGIEFYLIPELGYNIRTLQLGLLVFLVSLWITYIVRERSDLLFNSSNELKHSDQVKDL